MFQMLKLSKFFILFVLLSFFPTAKKVKAESVQFVFVEEKKPKTIFLFSGRASLFKLPCDITKAITGSPNDIKVEVDKIRKNELHLLLKKWKAQASNLILKCGQKVFLFSLIPSKNAHYDYVQVLAHVSSMPLKVKSSFNNSSNKDLKKQDFIIRKILDFSWGDKK